MGKFDNKVAIVSGGARGIGAAIAYRLGSEGAKIVLFDIDASAGTKRLEMLRSKGITGIHVHGDVASESDVSRCVRTAIETFERVDILVNNAGIGFSGKHLFEQTLEEWERIISVNLTGPYLFSKHSAKVMAELGGGVIINIASTRALQSEPNTEPYSASKGGLVALTHSLAASLAKHRIRVVAISPGWVDTSYWQIPPKESSLTELDHGQHLTGRVGKPEDIAALVSFLASDEASWITGVNFIIDGGMSVKMLYLDDTVIADTIAVLTGDSDLAKLLKLVISGDPKIQAKVKEVMGSLLESQH